MIEKDTAVPVGDYAQGPRVPIVSELADAEKIRKLIKNEKLRVELKSNKAGLLAKGDF